MRPRQRAVNLAHLLRQTACRVPDALAVAHGGTRWSWSELDSRVTALAAALRRRGVRPGDCVLLDGPNHPEYIQCMFAIWRAGAVVAPVNSRLHDNDIVSISEVCCPVGMIAHPRTASHAEAVAAARPLAAGILMMAASGPDSVAEVQELPEVSTSPDAMAWVGDHAWYFFTSGTSGTPKAAVLTHDQLGYVVTNHLADLMPTTDESDVSLVVAPLSHGAGVHLLPQVARGAASVLPVSTSLNPGEVWRLVEEEGVTNMFTVPTILKMLVEDAAVELHRHDSLEYVIYAGAPMPSTDQRRSREVLGEVLVQYYGLAEVTGNITVLPSRLHGRPSPEGVDYGTCGYPRTGMQVSVQNESGDEVPAGSPGEICVAGPGVFRGYLNNPAANEASFRDGWFRTGDVGFLDAQGFLYITGRLSDMYISGGSNVHPRDIEEKLLDHPAVREAVVFGVPDATWGEAGVAVCVVREDRPTSGDALREWLAPKMARYKVPKDIEIWAELPRSAYGKVARRAIRDAYLAGKGRRPTGAVREVLRVAGTVSS